MSTEVVVIIRKIIINTGSALFVYLLLMNHIFAYIMLTHAYHLLHQEFLKSVEEKLPPRLVRDTCYDKLLNNLRKHIPVQPPAPPPPPVEMPKEATPPSPQETIVVEPPSVVNDADKSAIVPPPPDKKFLIDKMAAYVSRNGPDFEVVVKMKNDPRFDFIAEGHVWNNYYKMRKAILEKVRV